MKKTALTRRQALAGFGSLAAATPLLADQSPVLAPEFPAGSRLAPTWSTCSNSRTWPSESSRLLCMPALPEAIDLSSSGSPSARA